MCKKLDIKDNNYKLISTSYMQKVRYKSCVQNVTHKSYMQKVNNYKLYGKNLHLTFKINVLLFYDISGGYGKSTLEGEIV